VPQRSGQQPPATPRPARTGPAAPVTEPLTVEGTTRFGTLFPNLSASIGAVEEELEKIRRDREAAAEQPAAPRPKAKY
jgi:hypothetical protein